ncbi:DEAD/DEAH box helicase [Tessaracoccus terricola]
MGNIGQPEGFYDALITRALAQRIKESGYEVSDSKIDADELADRLSEHFRTVLGQRLRELKERDRRPLVDDLLAVIGDEGEFIADDEPRVLHSLLAAAEPGRPQRYLNPPETPLADLALLTNAQGEPSMGHEVGSELGSADQVELLCAFIKWYGIRTLEKPLRSLRDRGVPLRVITSTYMGATERVALDRLINEFGAEVRISYENKRTRLHAKAWRFVRNTGFDTAYVGSSNLSSAAMLDGVEWNVRLTSGGSPDLLRKFAATFDTYWNDPAFEPYTPADGDRLDAALARARGGERQTTADLVSGLEVQPWPHQELILEALDVERYVHNRHRNLVVAATGTGKTVVAAIDYKRLGGFLGDRPTLLFVAHRKEILEQSMRTYREVLADGGFGELLVGGFRPTHWQHVFASVQSLNEDTLSSIDPKGFDVVVIDEFHHAEAASYRRILDHLEPRELLGLTATPERGDGVDVRSFFGGRSAYELRLWDALSSDLLSPFHYFGIADTTDLSAVPFARGRYQVGDLSGVFTGNDARSRIILQELKKKVGEPHRMRALGFCVDVKHAQYMAEVFKGAGLPAEAVHGETPAAERKLAVERLKRREVVALFTADLFNEGVDIPDVDTLLFLRPTESSMIFLQQLGRGLRRTADKPVLTVLDFVGHHRKEFNLAQRYRAVVGGSRKALKEQVERGFPYLPAGSQIILDEVTQQQVLENIRSQIATRWKHFLEELRAVGDVDLNSFLSQTDIELADLLQKGSFSQLRREAQLKTHPGGEHEKHLLGRLKALAHVDDVDRHSAYRTLLSDTAPRRGELDEEWGTWARMLFFSLWPNGGGFQSVEEGLEALRNERAFRAEATQVLDWALERAGHVARPLEGRLVETPLRSHARYTREELAAALQYAKLKRPPANLREGVFFGQELNVDALLVTLVKSEKHFSPTTMYRDYAINSTLFHWESQSRTSVDSPTGQRYLNQRTNGTEAVLFVRSTGAWEFGKGAPYTLLGDLDFVDHRGEKPIAITWRLRRPMPTEILQESSAVS